MPVIHPSDAVVHEMHGARFVSYARPGAGGEELCAWQGHPRRHRGACTPVSREEILHILEGELVITLDGRTERVTAGDTLIVVNCGATSASRTRPTGP